MIQVLRNSRFCCENTPRSRLRRQKFGLKIIMEMCIQQPQQMLNVIILFLWFSIHDLIRVLKVVSPNNIIIASSHTERAFIFLWILGNHIKYWLYCKAQGSSRVQLLIIPEAKSWKASKMFLLWEKRTKVYHRRQS